MFCTEWISVVESMFYIHGYYMILRLSYITVFTLSSALPTIDLNVTNTTACIDCELPSSCSYLAKSFLNNFDIIFQATLA